MFLYLHLSNQGQGHFFRFLPCYKFSLLSLIKTHFININILDQLVEVKEKLHVQKMGSIVFIINHGKSKYKIAFCIG